jgi:glutathione synthase/RimK-type ligase-like ATP-grasp enzyme
MDADVILATASRLPRADEDDPLLRAALAAAGVSAQTLAWDDPGVDWGRARACVIRSTWNYVHHYDAFLGWAERCAAVTTLWNPFPIVRWSSHKRYLLELAGAGLPVTPTRLAPQGQPADLTALAGEWSQLVIKPAISAGSFKTRRVARAEFATTGQAHLDAVLARHDALVQPFLASVEDYGERALVWIDGALTHAVRKSPRFAGDPQRVSAASVPIAHDEAALAESVLAAVPQPLLYARVDLARDAHGRPCLMELELVEPSLFLDRAPAAVARLAAAIRERVI